MKKLFCLLLFSCICFQFIYSLSNTHTIGNQGYNHNGNNVCHRNIIDQIIGCSIFNTSNLDNKLLSNYHYSSKKSTSSIIFKVATQAEAVVFAIQPSCINDVPQSDGYLQLSAVTDGDKLNFSTGNTYTGPTDYADASALTIGALPFQFNTGLSNPSGSQDYTIRVFNGASDCFTDVVVTMNEQDCTVGCECKDQVYLNDTDQHLVHKFQVQANGSLLEIGSPWLGAEIIENPHGVVTDVNGRLYIAQVGGAEGNRIVQLNCDGEVLDFDFIIGDFGYNLITDGANVYSNGFPFNGYSLCDGSYLGCNGSWQANGWGLTVGPGGNWYATTGFNGANNRVGYGPLSADNFEDPCSAGTGTTLIDTDGFPTTNNARPMGLVFDSSDNLYVVVTEDNGVGAAKIMKFSSAGVFISETALDASADQVGWYGARGITYSSAADLLYVASLDDCITVFNTSLVEQVAFKVPHVPATKPKAIGITTECCPTNNNITIDTVLCTASVNDQISLQELINCDGTICEGLWVEGDSNRGLAYNSCDNSVTIDALNACGSFTLESDGTGNNPQCGAFKVEVNIKVINLSISASQTECTDNGNGTFTATYDVIVDWSNMSCTYDETVAVTHNGSTIAMIDANTATSPDTFNVNIPADGQGIQLFKAAFTEDIECDGDSLSFKTPLPCPIDVSTCVSTTGCLGGNVFEDFNCNGADDTNEPGVQGVQIQAYDCDNNLVGTGYSDSEGDWQICGLTDGTAYRIEHVLPESVACWATPTHVGNDNGSDIQFLTAPNCTQFSVSSPDSYCQENPYIGIACYGNGDPLAAGNGALDAFVTFPYDANSPDATTQNPLPTKQATVADVGAVWGSAFQQSSKTMFASAVMRRFVGFGSLGTGGIYKFDFNDPSVALPGTFAHDYIDVNTLGIPTGADTRNAADPCNSLATTTTGPAHDIDAWDAVGKRGIGDIDYDSDNNTLWLVNLFDKKLYGIKNIDPATTPVAADVVGGIDIALPNGLTCTDGNLRPWAVTYEKGMLYIGAVCDSEYDFTGGGLKGYILKIDPNNLAYGFSIVTEVDLSYALGDYGNSATTVWYTWIPLSTAESNPFIAQPILSDIEFDADGSIIVGLMDRQGLQVGHQNHNIPLCSNTDTSDAATAGDILRFCFDGNNYIADSEAGCTTPTNSLSIAGTEEYYWGEHGPTSGSTDDFNEIVLGGLTLLHGSGQVVTNVFDATAFDQGGILTLDNSTGGDVNRYGIYNSGGGASSTFGKSVGLGEPQLICDPAPLEIGNYVWCDSLENGIQDACEQGINDLIVQLYDRDGNLVGQDTTVNGQYYFNENNVDTTGITVTIGITTPTTGWSGMSYKTQYFIVFGESQFTTTKFTVGGEIYGITSMVNIGSNDNIDSDVDGSNLTAGSLGARPNDLPFIDLMTSATGCGDHKYDLGITCIFYDWGDLPDNSVTTSIGDYQTSDTNNGPAHRIISGLHIGSTVDEETDGQQTTDALGDGADEDGFSFPSTLNIIPGGVLNLPINVTNTTGSTAHYEVWIDWNGDGDFDDLGEMVTNLSDDGTGDFGHTHFTVNVPDDAATNQLLGFRARLSNTDNMTPYGPIDSGEVEDYLITISCKEKICLPVNITIKRGTRN